MSGAGPGLAGSSGFFTSFGRGTAEAGSSWLGNLPARDRVHTEWRIRRRRSAVWNSSAKDSFRGRRSMETILENLLSGTVKGSRLEHTGFPFSPLVSLIGWSLSSTDSLHKK